MNLRPHRKVSAAGAGGGLATLLIALAQTLGVSLSPEAAGLIATIAAFVGGWLTRERGGGSTMLQTPALIPFLALALVAGYPHVSLDGRPYNGTPGALGVLLDAIAPPALAQAAPLELEHFLSPECRLQWEHESSTAAEGFRLYVGDRLALELPGSARAAPCAELGITRAGEYALILEAYAGERTARGEPVPFVLLARLAPPTGLRIVFDGSS